jgi:hypothetical protein
VCSTFIVLWTLCASDRSMLISTVILIAMGQIGNMEQHGKYIPRDIPRDIGFVQIGLIDRAELSQRIEEN